MRFRCAANTVPVTLEDAVTGLDDCERDDSPTQDVASDRVSVTVKLECSVRSMPVVSMIVKLAAAKCWKYDPGCRFGNAEFKALRLEP
jgi:hypothetical protein